MAAIPNILNMVAGINERKRNAREREALQNYLQDPDGAIAAVMEVNPVRGIQMDAFNTAQEQAAAEARAKRIREGFRYLRGMPEGTDIGATLDGMSGFLGGMGYGEEELAAMKNIAAQPGFNPDMMDDDAWKAFIGDQYDTQVLTPGSHAIRGGEVLHRVPYKLDTVTTTGGDGSQRRDVFDPNTGEFNPASGGYAPAEAAPAGPGPVGNWSVEDLRPHFIAQESSGDYTAKNGGTGALGAYQIMPDTGRALAARVGVAWRPDLMVSDTPEGRKYQDAIGGAAIQEAIGAGDDVFSYYYGGSDRSKWGPNTRRYDAEMRERVGTGGGTAQQTQSGAPISMPGRAPKPASRVRPATQQELPPGATYAQVDETGKLINIRYPTATETKAAGAAAGASPEKKNAVSGTLGQLVSSYIQLDELDGIVDPEEGTLANIGARISSSGVGQFFGGAVGTETQSVREQINNIRPLLIQQIREATGMSARAMDSNRELEFYLQAATDAKKDIVSNLAAIQVLDTIYGNGQALRENLDPEMYERVRKRAGTLMRTNPIKDTGVTTTPNAPRVGEVRRGYKFKGGDPASPSSWEKVQ